MTMTMKSVTLTLCVFVAFLANVNAITSSLVLHNAPSVASGASSIFNCTSSGNGNDPVIRWTLEGSSGVVRSDSDLPSVYVSGTSNSNDGAITSSVTLYVEASYLTSTHRLYCGAYDNSASSPTLRIYTVLAATSANLGQVCAASDCAPAFSICSTSESPSRCRCQSNYFDTNGDNTAGGSCNPKVGLGATCVAGNDASCLTTNAECSLSSPFICQCQSGYVQSNSVCVLSSASLGQSCVNPTRSCYVQNSHCNNVLCVCNTDYVQSGSACISNNAGVFDSCVNPTRSCPANAFCNGATCQCSSGYTYSSTTSSCVSSSATVGGSCTNPTRTCPDNSFCGGTCQCNSGYFAYSGLCFSNTAGIGQSCVNPSRSCSSNAFCNGATCQCNSGYVYSSSTGTCLSNSAGIGDSCVNPSRSCPSNANCNVATCQCNSGYVYSSSTGSCLTSSASIGDSCTNPSRSCPSNAFCNGAVCQCNGGYVLSSSTGTCVTNSAGVGASCVNPSRSCPSNAFCNGATCQCNSGYVYSSSTGSCVASSASIGDSCTNPSRSCPSNAFCNGAVCQCNGGYVLSSSTGTCVTNSAGVGDSCVNPTRTCPSNANCNGGTCQCNSGYVYSSSTGTCATTSASIGQSCTNPQRNCPQNANCGNGVCQCNTGYTTSGNSCQQPGNLGEACNQGSNVTCSAAYSVCSNTNICICQSGYVNSLNSTCNIPTLGQSCTTSIGCQSTTLGSSTQCLNSVCSCLSNYYTLNNDCYQKRGLGVSCTQSVSNSCADTYATCTGSSNPTCQCNSGYVQTGSTCVQDTSSQSCPASSQTTSIVTGISSPSASTTPSVRVERTCYSVNLYDTQQMACKDNKAGLLRSARWIKLPNSVVIASTGSFINGDQSNPNLTVSNAQASYAGSYKCQLCYGEAFTRCTNSSTIVLYVQGTAISSVSVSTSPSTTPTKGDQVTMTCGTSPAGVATSYVWYKGSAQIGTGSTYTVAFASASSSGEYSCTASNSYGTQTSSGVTVDVQYSPEFSLVGGGSTQTVEWNFDNGDVDITCAMTANPAITRYYFYDGNNNLLTSPFTTSNTFTVTSSLGYQTYSCRAENAIATSSSLYFDVVEESAANTGAATEDTGISTGTIAAIVLGIIFFLLLLIIIIVCCCNYGWCRKKEKVEPQPPPPAAKPYIPRNIVSAHSTVTRKDVGIMMNGHHDVSVSTDFEEPRYTTPRYHLKPAKNSGPIISMFDDGYEQPRAHQLPALDTQYLYTDEEPKKRLKKKKKKRHHRESSPRRHDYEAEPVTLPPSDEDLVVIPGKQNYFE